VSPIIQNSKNVRTVSDIYKLTVIFREGKAEYETIEKAFLVGFLVCLNSFADYIGLFGYNPDGLEVLKYVGWAILAVGFAIGYLGVFTLKRKSRVPEGKSFVHTALTDSGIYAVVRHPQYLSWIFVSFGIIVIAQHWLVVVSGVGVMVAVYMQARQDDRSLIERFGDDYERYIESASRMNLLVGVIRLLRRRKRE